MLRKNRFMQFWAEDDGGGGGGGSSVSDILGPVGSPPIDDGGEGEGEGETTPPLTSSASPTVDAAELAKQFGSVLGEHFKQRPQVQAPPEPKLSREEAAKLLNMWEPGDDFIQEFGNLETQKAAFAKMRDALIRQSDTITQIRLQEMQQRWEERFNPVQSLIEQHTAAQREQRFGDTYPQLSNPALRPLLSTIVQQLAAGGKLNGDELANFKAIATGVEAVIKATNPDFKLDAKTASATTPVPKTRSGGIPVTTPGAGGGGGGAPSSANASGVPKLVGLLGKVR